MTTKRLAVLIGCGAVLVAVGAAVYRARRPAERPASGELGAACGPGADEECTPAIAGDRETERLRARIRGMELRLADLQIRSVATPGPAPAPEPEPPAAPPSLTAEQGQALVASRMRQLDEAIQREVVDPKWAEDSQRTLATAFAEGQFKGTSLLSSECKATMCRMEAIHDDPASLAAFEEIRFRQPMSYYFQPLDDVGGRKKTVAYFIRQGMELGDDHVFARLWRAR